MAFPVRFFRVSGRSMEPTLSDGEYVLMSRLHRSIKRGDVVLFRHPAKPELTCIKRVSGIERGALFVEGDNAGESEDSRHFGPIAVGSVLGKVLAAGL